MKILLVGLGAIGKRHCDNIVALGHDVYAVDLDSKNLARVSEKCRGVYTSLNDAMAINPDVAIICTYSNQHINLALKCANAGAHIFIEKPLSLSMEGVSELISVCRKRRLITMVGCNMRFHPGIKLVHDIVSKKQEFKKILWAGLEFGYYLPFAKPQYKKTYLANKDLGGSIIFDCIHELDYALWFMGKPDQVFCTKGIVSDLEIDTQDYADIIVKFESGAVCNVHFDYLQHAYSRHCKIVAQDGTVWWDFCLGKVGVATKRKKEWVWKDSKAELYYNKMYVDEMKYFLGCIRAKKKTMNSVEDSAKVIRLAIAAKKSSQSGKWEKVGI